MTLVLRYAAESDVGLLRDGNEDALYAGPRLLAVADGMGGAAAGEVASRVAIAAVSNLDLERPGSDLVTAMRDAVELANGHIRDMVAADSELEGMGTTLTAVLFAGRRLGIVHVGDSRAYLLRDGRFSQITHDHTFVQSLVDEGQITAEEATVHPGRSWITRALDGREDIDLDLSIREALAGDRYLLCSDGLSGPVSEDTLADTLRSVADPADACRRLVELALRAGGPDNVSCVVADIVDVADEPDPEPIVAGAATDHVAPRRTADTPAARAAQLTERSASRPVAAILDAGGRLLRRRLAIVIGSALLLVGIGILATWLVIRTQYYVGTDPAGGSSSATVAIYRGVDGSALGIGLSSLEQRTDVPVAELPADERDRIGDGIPATSLSDARSKVANLRATACALAQTSGLGTSTATPAGATPSPSPSPATSGPPSWCDNPAGSP